MVGVVVDAVVGVVVEAVAGSRPRPTMKWPRPPPRPQALPPRARRSPASLKRGELTARADDLAQLPERLSMQTPKLRLADAKRLTLPLVGELGERGRDPFGIEGGAEGQELLQDLPPHLERPREKNGNARTAGSCAGVCR